jgi:hypothetical protein
MLKSSPSLKLNDLDPQPPRFCDFFCPYASFAPEDASGACRREQAVYCKPKKTYNNKNAACLFRRRKGRNVN